MRYKLRLPGRLIKIVLVTAIGFAFLGAYSQSGQPITLLVNGEPYPIRSHRLTVEAVLLQTGVTLNPADTLWPPPESNLAPNQNIEINLARPVKIAGDGQTNSQTIFTHQQTPAAIYAELGINISEADDVFVDGALWNFEQPIPITLPAVSAPVFNLQNRIESRRPETVQLNLHRAIPINISDDGQTSAVQTTAQSVGEILLAQNIPIYLGDAVSPDLSAPLSPNMTIAIERSVPVSVVVDGQQIKTRTRKTTVADVLAQEKIVLVGQDYTIPAENEPIEANESIKIVRVVESLEIEQETTDFETIWVSDPNLELDTQQIQQKGQEGVTKTRTRVRYENGEEAARAEEETWLEYEPADKVIAYGTSVVIRTLDTPDGPIEYWRKIRMLATGYSAATSGKSKDHPAYGITRSGLQAGYGIVAVDPGVISLLADVYVPGYGKAIAGDTGGAILGKRIDLGFDEDAPPPWYKWTEVYVLTPVPPQSEIRYVLPQWPQER